MCKAMNQNYTAGKKIDLTKFSKPFKIKAVIFVMNTNLYNIN